MRRLNNLIQWLGLVVTAYAVYTEMKKPAEQRTWHGMVADVIPYDFRAPTLERAKARLWNPDDPQLIMPTVFGVGWTMNLAQLFKMGQYYVEGMQK